MLLKRLLTGTALALGLAAFFALAASAQQGGWDKFGGSSTDVFNFYMEGFTPGTNVTDVFISPKGLIVPLLLPDGSEAVWTIGDAGIIAYQLVPSQDLPNFVEGGGPGTWLQMLCVVETDQCWEVELFIAA